MSKQTLQGPDQLLMMGSLNLRGGNWGERSEGNKVRQTLTQVPATTAILLLQEVRSQAKQGGVDPRNFGYRHYHGSDSLTILVKHRLAYIRRIHKAPPDIEHHVLAAEVVLKHSPIGPIGIFNLHLPSPTHSHPQLCARIVDYMHNMINKWRTSLSWIIAGGDFNEVELRTETSRTFRDPLIIPQLQAAGMATWPGPGSHTFHQDRADGTTRSTSRLDRWMASPPPTGIKLRTQLEPQWIVDSDHGLLMVGISIPRARLASASPPQWPIRFPDKSPIEGYGYNSTRMVFSTQMLVHLEAATAAAELAEQYGFTLEHSTHMLTLSRDQPLHPQEAAILGEGLEGIKHLKPYSGTKGLRDYLRNMDPKTQWTLGSLQHQIRHAMAERIQPREVKPTINTWQTHQPLLESLVHTLRIHVKATRERKASPRTPKHIWKLAKLTLTDPLQTRLQKVRQALRKLTKSIRSTAIRTAVEKRQSLEAQHDPSWYSRIKHSGQELRTDAHWDAAGWLNFSPEETRQHFAHQVQQLGSLAQPPQHPSIPPWSRTLSPRSSNALIRDVTADEVSTVLQRMGARRSPGPDGITVTTLRYIPPQLLAVAVTHAMDNSAAIPPELAEANVRLLNKTDHSYPPSGKFRPIALLSTLYKLVTAILSARLNKALKEDQMMPDNSHAFLPDTHICHPISLRRSLIELAHGNKSMLIISDFDASAAFNSPPHQVIQQTWQTAGCPDQFVDLAMALLTISSSRAITEHGLAEKLPNLRGSVQGDVISPLHWAGVMAPHQHHWARHLPHIQIGLPQQQVCMEVYADDVAAYAQQVDHAELQHTAYHQACADIGVKSHPGKAVVIAINLPNPLTLMVDGKQIAACVEHPPQGYRYLGVHFHPDHQRGPYYQALEEIRTLGTKYKLFTANLRELKRLINAMVIPKLRYQLQWTATSSQDIHSLQSKLNGILYHKGLPRVLSSKTIHDPKVLGFGSLEDSVHKARWTAYFALLAKASDPTSSATKAAAAEMDCISKATASLPHQLQGLQIFTSPRLARHILAPGTMARAVCESLCHWGVWWQTSDTPRHYTIGEALPTQLTMSLSKELDQVINYSPELIYTREWNDGTGLWINRSLVERFPHLTSCMGESTSPEATVSKWPTQDIPFLPGTFCVIPHIATTTDWSAFVMQIQPPLLGDPIDKIRVKTLTEDPDTTIYHLPADTEVEEIDADICSAIALIPHASGGWAIALEHQALIQAYQPNMAARNRHISLPWNPPTGSEVYTDGSYDGEAVGLAAVSNDDSPRSVRCWGGWESELSTAQEGEIAAMALALQGIPLGGTIHTDSKFAHDIANKLAQPGRFAPFICKFIRQEAARKRATVRKVKAHLQTVEDKFPSNHYADQWAKLGTQQAFGLLQRGHIPHEWRPNTRTWLTIHSSDGLWLHDPRRFSKPDTLARPSWYKWLDLKAKIKVELVLGSYWGTDYTSKACTSCWEDVDTPSHPLMCTRQRSGGKLLEQWYEATRQTMPWPMWKLPWIPLWPTAAHAHTNYRQCPQGFANDDTTRHEFHPPIPGCTVIHKHIIGWASHIDPTCDPTSTLEKWAPQGWGVVPPAPIARVITQTGSIDEWTSYSNPDLGEWTCPAVLAFVAPHCQILKRSTAHGYTYWDSEECLPPSPFHGPASRQEANLHRLTSWGPPLQTAQEALLSSGGCPLLGIWELKPPNDHVLDVTLSSPDYSLSRSAITTILANL